MKKPILYVYDGTFEGFLCCVFETVYSRNIPVGIIAQGHCKNQEQASCIVQKIKTQKDKAIRVYVSIEKKICKQAQELVRDVFCSNLEKREMMLLRFLLFGYRHGKQVYFLKSHVHVKPLYEAQKKLYQEVELLTRWASFQKSKAGIFVKLTPKNFVLPYLYAYIHTNFPFTDTLFYDETHQTVLLKTNETVCLQQKTMGLQHILWDQYEDIIFRVSSFSSKNVFCAIQYWQKESILQEVCSMKQSRQEYFLCEPLVDL